MDIAAWLRGLGLERYAQAFRANDVDADVLPKLTADDLKDSASPRSATAASCSRRSPPCAPAAGSGAATAAAAGARSPAGRPAAPRPSGASSR